VAGEAKSATVTIKVPKDASPGGHYGVVRFTALPPEGSTNQVALNASIGTLVLLHVSGDVKVETGIEEFKTGQYSIYRDGQGAEVTEFQAKTMFEQGPIQLQVRIRNSGNVHIKPQGTITIKNMWGSTVAQLPYNSTNGNVLPGSIRKFDSQFEGKRLFGRYRAELAIQYGDGQTLNQTIRFWVIPYKVVLIVLALLVAIVLLIVWLLRQYKRRILAQNHSPKSPPKV
jgi:hypothetical protein